jgi:hypothetical protein
MTQSCLRRRWGTRGNMVSEKSSVRPKFRVVSPNIDLKLSLDYRWVVIFTSGWQILYLITIIVSQSMAVFPSFSRSSLHCEKCLHPKNPRWADNGEGCTALRMWCLQCNELLEKDGKTAIDWTKLPQQWAGVYTKCMILNWWLYQRANGFRTRIENTDLF